MTNGRASEDAGNSVGRGLLRVIVVMNAAGLMLAVIAAGPATLEQAVETLRTRVDATGVKEPSITQKGNRRINVQLPGAVDLEETYTLAEHEEIIAAIAAHDADAAEAALVHHLERSRSLYGVGQQPGA